MRTHIGVSRCSYGRNGAISPLMRGSVAGLGENGAMDLARTALHEAGHCTAAYLLGATAHAGPVTIEPATAYRGICFSGHPPRFPSSDLAGLEVPYPLLPARLRRFYETAVMVYSAGEIAVELHADPDGSPAPADLPEAKPADPDGSPALPRREAVQLEEAAALDSVDSDFTKVMRILRSLHFDDSMLAHRHRQFLALECEAMLSGKRARRMVQTLAGELMQHRTLSAQRWRSILAAAGEARP
jgi:hypothetical protein